MEIRALSDWIDQFKFRPSKSLKTLEATGVASIFISSPRALEGVCPPFMLHSTSSALRDATNLLRLIGLDGDPVANSLTAFQMASKTKGAASAMFYNVWVLSDMLRKADQSGRLVLIS